MSQQQLNDIWIQERLQINKVVVASTYLLEDFLGLDLYFVEIKSFWHRLRLC
jgi:hypothetical protein